ncbi:MAG: hypothetical protein ACFFD4_21660 [Candidatus Odinarchaeota archaeon]
MSPFFEFPLDDNGSLLLELDEDEFIWRIINKKPVKNYFQKYNSLSKYESNTSSKIMIRLISISFLGLLAALILLSYPNPTILTLSGGVSYITFIIGGSFSLLKTRKEPLVVNLPNLLQKSSWEVYKIITIGKGNDDPENGYMNHKSVLGYRLPFETYPGPDTYEYSGSAYEWSGLYIVFKDGREVEIFPERKYYGEKASWKFTDRDFDDILKKSLKHLKMERKEGKIKVGKREYRFIGRKESLVQDILYSKKMEKITISPVREELRLRSIACEHCDRRKSVKNFVVYQAMEKEDLYWFLPFLSKRLSILSCRDCFLEKVKDAVGFHAGEDSFDSLSWYVNEIRTALKEKTKKEIIAGLLGYTLWGFIAIMVVLPFIFVVLMYSTFMGLPFISSLLIGVLGYLIVINSPHSMNIRHVLLRESSLEDRTVSILNEVYGLPCGNLKFSDRPLFSKIVVLVPILIGMFFQVLVQLAIIPEIEGNFIPNDIPYFIPSDIPVFVLTLIPVLAIIFLSGFIMSYIFGSIFSTGPDKHLNRLLPEYNNKWILE